MGSQPYLVSIPAKDPKEFEEDLRINIAAADDYLGYSIFDHDEDLDQTLEQDMSDTEDWDMSDNRDNDSLKGLLARQRREPRL